MTECPSKAWDRYVAGEEEAHNPTDEDMLAGLDAYGHLSFVVGYGADGDDRGDWLACFDYEVFDHPERGKLVAYHVVVDSDSGGFCDTLETAVVPADKAPYNLPDYWAGIGMEHECWTEEEHAAAFEMNKRWNQDLRAALEATDGDDL